MGKCTRCGDANDFLFSCGVCGGQYCEHHIQPSTYSCDATARSSKDSQDDAWKTESATRRAKTAENDALSRESKLARLVARLVESRGDLFGLTRRQESLPVHGGKQYDTSSQEESSSTDSNDSDREEGVFRGIPRSFSRQISTLRRDGDLTRFLLVLGLLLTAEVLVSVRYVEIALGLHLIGGLMCIIFIQECTGPTVSLFQSLTLIPVYRIVSIGFPSFTNDPFLFLGAIYLLVLLSIVSVIRSQDLSLPELGFSLRKSSLIVPGVGIGLLAGIFQNALSIETLPYEQDFQHIVILIAVGGLVGLVKELLFRGLIQRWAGVVFEEWFAIIATSVLFAFTYTQWLSPTSILFSGFLSVVIGWAYARSNNMWFGVSIHGATNVSGTLLIPLSLDGMSAIVPIFFG